MPSLLGKRWVSHSSCLLGSPGQVASYKGRQVLPSQRCPVISARPGAGAAQNGTDSKDGDGAWGLPTWSWVLWGSDAAGKTLTQSPSQGLTLRLRRGLKLLSHPKISPSRGSSQAHREHLHRGFPYGQNPPTENLLLLKSLSPSSACRFWPGWGLTQAKGISQDFIKYSLSCPKPPSSPFRMAELMQSFQDKPAIALSPNNAIFLFFS